MKVAVIGLWHLGLVTAACVAKAGHEVMAFDPDQTLVAKLQMGELPIFEPGLKELIQESNDNHALKFSNNLAELEVATIVWITFDTPVNDDDIADVETVMQECQKIIPYLNQEALVILSSQLPVGSVRKLKTYAENICPDKNLSFASIPENLRLGKAIEVFTKPDRFVVGLSNPEDKQKIIELLGFYTSHLIWMSVESAEMTKHAINAFLATSVTFINELAVLCETVGANAREVEQGLKSEERIGPKAYLRPGGAIGGGTLVRDVQYLTQMAEQNNNPAFLLNSIMESNAYHKTWLKRKIKKCFAELKNRTFTVCGLAYKVGTNTLRRSLSLEICEWLYNEGCKIKAFDPVISELPAPFNQYIQLNETLQEALEEADAIIVTSDYPEFKNISLNEILTIFDPSGFLRSKFLNHAKVNYLTVGEESI